jgi:hypothetical protein
MTKESTLITQAKWWPLVVIGKAKSIFNRHWHIYMHHNHAFAYNFHVHWRL